MDALLIIVAASGISISVVGTIVKNKRNNGNGNNKPV